ncbi:MAG: lipoyl synthase [Desulfarculaceae bacterium]|nr:lipoyl synthase [Desulfarculaceae bacterium]
MKGISMNRDAAPLRKPSWLRRSLSSTGQCGSTNRAVSDLGLNTVCREAQCPNRQECFGRGTATFLLLGPSCTRACRFCAVDKTPAAPPDPGEPGRVAEACARLGLEFCVLTMVTRDDLPDGGAAHVAATIAALGQYLPGVGVEVLISDLGGDPEALATVLAAAPQVLNHNLETVPRLYEAVRPQADYGRSLELLSRASQAGHVTKSGLMLGLGESEDEVLAALQDLRSVGCQILTLGQYLAPSARHYPVARYVPPEEFDHYRERALAMGFGAVASAPLVRSSYQAQAMYQQCLAARP